MNPLHGGFLAAGVHDVSRLPWRWTKFEPHEFASKGNGEIYWHEPTFDAIQRTRDILGAPININSAHRDWLHNIAVGGAPRSAHLFIALDVSTRGHDRAVLWKALRLAGFMSAGFYNTFIHCDLRRGRRWYGSLSAKKLWEPILNMQAPEIAL